MMKKELIVFKEPKSPISEIFRTLRTNIQFMDAKKSSKSILITSTFAGEGKSWISSNLAVSFAQTGRKVLLIDADMRKGRQYTIFGISPRPGLSNYLSGVNISDTQVASENIMDYIQETEVENLYVMSAGNIPPNPSELLISPPMMNLLEEAKKIYDIIIIDGTPSQLVADSLILARLVDATVIITACKETKKEDLKRVITNIQNVGGKIAGIILNKIVISTKKYEQKYYYYGSKSKGNANGGSRLSQSHNNIPKREENTANPQPNVEEKNENENKNEDQNENVWKNNIENTNINADISTNINTNENINTNVINNNQNGAELSTNDLLKQINEYLDKEKGNLN